MTSYSNIRTIFMVAGLLPLAIAFHHGIPPASVQVIPQPPNSEQILSSDPISTTRPRCGENYVTHTGGVFYKPFEQVLEHERCVWVINVPSALGYSINVQFMSTPTNQLASGKGLVLTGFTWNNTEPVFVNNFLPTSVGTFIISNANLVVVTFFSSEQVEGSQNTGVVLEYEAIYEGNITPIAATSTQLIMEPPTFYMRNALVGTTYASSQLLTYIFPPNNHIYGGNLQTIHYQLSALEGATCNDSLFVFKFNASSAGLETYWEDGGRICGDVTNAIITHDDVIVVLFQTNSEDTNYAGFFWSVVAC